MISSLKSGRKVVRFINRTASRGVLRFGTRKKRCPNSSRLKSALNEEGSLKDSLFSESTCEKDSSRAKRPERPDQSVN